MKDRAYIVVSGLPAAGKTAIGRYIAGRLGLPFLDKDEFLEREFQRYASVDLQLRQQLSRKSDETMMLQAIALERGVLVSFWRPDDRDVSFGTSTSWLKNQTTPVIELYCRCDAQIAQERFKTRRRHLGHNDALRRDSLAQQFEELEPFGPLGLWPVVVIDTSNLDDISALGDAAVRSLSGLLDSNS